MKEETAFLKRIIRLYEVAQYENFVTVLSGCQTKKNKKLKMFRQSKVKDVLICIQISKDSKRSLYRSSESFFGRYIK